MPKFIIGFDAKKDCLVQYLDKYNAIEFSEDWLEIEADTLEEALNYENYEIKFQEWKKQNETV